MRKLIYVCLAIFFCQINLYSQKETNWWHFGVKAGINFNSVSDVAADDGTVISDMPQAITGYLSTYEGCFTLSTYDGKLLMSSDGMTVYDKNGAVMTNGTGLLGHPSATQSGIVAPKPGSSTEYYIITVRAADGPANGIRYSLVDLSLNNGLGAVVSKNNTIQAGGTDENISVIPNANENDYWLIHRTAKTFYVWAITDAGISATPHQTVVTSTINSGTLLHQIGETIVSPDQTKIASFNYSGRQIVSAEFDKTTGLISNVKTLGMPIVTYGGAFSANSQYLYVAAGNFPNGLYVGAWANLRAGIVPAVLPASTQISNVKLGSDKRLYGIHGYVAGGHVATTKSLFVVTDPDNGGGSVKKFTNYLKNGAYVGLPAFSSGFIRITGKEQPFACVGNNRTYSIKIDITGGNAPSKLEWDFGDGSTPVTQNVNLSQTIYSVQHSYSSTGTYNIKITPSKADGTKLKPVAMTANIVNCTLKTNRMTRSDLLNSKQQ